MVLQVATIHLVVMKHQEVVVLVVLVQSHKVRLKVVMVAQEEYGLMDTTMLVAVVEQRGQVILVALEVLAVAVVEILLVVLVLLDKVVVLPEIVGKQVQMHQTIV
jgi:hypothetical protein